MRDYDDFTPIFRVWSDVLGGLTGLLVGLAQFFVGANLLVIALSVFHGVAAGEIAFRLGQQEALPGPALGRPMCSTACFVAATALTASTVLVCYNWELGIASGAMIVLMAIAAGGNFCGAGRRLWAYCSLASRQHFTG